MNSPGRRTIISYFVAALLLVCACGKGNPAKPKDPPGDDPPPPPSVPGGRIAFYGHRANESASGLIVVNPDGSGATYVTTTGGFPQGIMDALEPTWSPDGTKFVFRRTYWTASGRTFRYVCTANSDGSNVVQLTNTALNDSTDHGGAAWTPDGTKIVFGAGPVLSVMNVDGTGVMPFSQYMPQYPANAGWPSWSRDGSKVTFSGRGAAYDYPRIFVMNVDGTGLTALTPSSSCGDVAPVLSPDGTKIAFKRNLRCSDFTAAIWVMNADGTNPKVMAYSAAAVWMHGPRWSPDGTAIAWNSSYDAPPYRYRRIYRRGLTDSLITSVYGGHDGEVNGTPDWGP